MNTPQQLPLTLPLRESSTLESFVAGDNQALMTLLVEMPANVGQAFIWGDPGTGRSHLLEASVRRALGRGMSACLLSGSEMLRAAPAMLDGLESMALVAIDDVDDLSGRKDWEEALFHLYNRIQAEQGMMLFTARQPPAGAGFRLPDLSSRLAAGPVFQLHPLDDEGHLLLLQRRAQARGLVLGEEVARYLLSRTSRSTASLLDQLDQLDRAALIHKHRLTVPFVKKVLCW